MNIKNISLIAVALFTLLIGFKSKNRQEKLKVLISNKSWLISLMFIICFIIYIEYFTHDNDSEDSRKLKISLKKSIITLIISIFSELGLTIAPFWLVFVLSYYMEGWI